MHLCLQGLRAGGCQCHAPAPPGPESLHTSDVEEDAELDGNGTDSSEVDGDVGDVTPGMGVGRADAERRQFAAGFRTKVLVLVLSRALYQGHQQGSPQCKCQAGQPKENASGLGTGTYSGTVAAADAPSPVHPAASGLLAWTLGFPRTCDAMTLFGCTRRGNWNNRRNTWW